MEKYGDTPEPISVPPFKADEFVRTSSTIVAPALFSEVYSFSKVEDITMEEIHAFPKLAASSENTYPIKSLQELEQFTLPVAIHSCPLSTEHFNYRTFHPTIPIEGCYI